MISNLSPVVNWISLFDQRSCDFNHILCVRLTWDYTRHTKTNISQNAWSLFGLKLLPIWNTNLIQGSCNGEVLRGLFSESLMFQPPFLDIWYKPAKIKISGLRFLDRPEWVQPKGPQRQNRKGPLRSNWQGPARRTQACGEFRVWAKLLVQTVLPVKCTAFVLHLIIWKSTDKKRNG